MEEVILGRMARGAAFVTLVPLATFGNSAHNGGMAAMTDGANSAKVGPLALARLNWLERWLDRLQPREGLAEHLATGWRGEMAAYFHLRRLGYTIVAQGWRSHISAGDLDLVGWDGNRLCFVEVKARSARDKATAEAAVDEEKRRTLRRLARRYLKRAAVPEAAARFDVVTVYFEQAQEPEISLVRGAFGWK